MWAEKERKNLLKQSYQRSKNILGGTNTHGRFSQFSFTKGDNFPVHQSPLGKSNLSKERDFFLWLTVELH